MGEKELCKGTFRKMNIPAVICLILAVFFAVQYVDIADDRWAATSEVTMMQILMILFLVLAVVFFVWMSGCSITVTDKRVYGVGAFRKRVDLPFDMISSVGSAPLNSVAVATASGKICFWFVANRNEIFDAISNCLIARQSGTHTEVPVQVPHSNAEELRQYKELLDSGVISQEEFDAKKKQLLGL